MCRLFCTASARKCRGEICGPDLWNANLQTANARHRIPPRSQCSADAAPLAGCGSAVLSSSAAVVHWTLFHLPERDLNLPPHWPVTAGSGVIDAHLWLLSMESRGRPTTRVLGEHFAGCRRTLRAQSTLSSGCQKEVDREALNLAPSSEPE